MLTCFSFPQVYLNGDKVSHAGQFFQARWWNTGTQPGGGQEVWQAIGNSCDNKEVQPVEAEENNEDEDEDEVEDEKEEEDKDEDSENSIEEDSHKAPTGPPSKLRAEAREAELTDTPLFDLVRASIATLESDKVEQVKANRAANPENVRRLEKILSKKGWQHIFPMRDPAYSYTRFLQAVAKFPAICATYSDGRDSDQICRLALTMCSS